MRLRAVRYHGLRRRRVTLFRDDAGELSRAAAFSSLWVSGRENPVAEVPSVLRCSVCVPPVLLQCPAALKAGVEMLRSLDGRKVWNIFDDG
jgi:hypothetical protein